MLGEGLQQAQRRERDGLRHSDAPPCNSRHRYCSMYMLVVGPARVPHGEPGTSEITSFSHLRSVVVVASPLTNDEAMQ